MNLNILYKIDWAYIQELLNYWNKSVKYSNNVSVALEDGKATGIVIGVGLNLGTTSRAELLTKYGLDQAVVNQLSPYIGVSGPEALAMANNLNTDNLDIASLKNKIQHVLGSGLAKEFNKTSSTPFHELLPTQQTLVATMQQTLLSPVAQKNSIINTASNVLSNAASDNWEGVLDNLADFTNHVQNDDSFEARLINKMINESEKKLQEEVKKQTSKQTKKLVDTVIKPKEDGTKKPDSAESDRSALNEPEGGIKFNADKVNWTYIHNLSSHWNKGVKFSNNVSVALKDGKATGIIIGIGLNLGTASRAELLTKYGLDQAVVNQLSPYIGLNGSEALAMANNLNVDNLDIDAINAKMQHVMCSGLAKEFNKTSSTPFHELLPTQQTLVATMQQTLLSPVSQKNSIVNLASSVVSNAASGNWEGVLGNLVDFTNHVKNDDSFEARLINKMINESEKKLKEEVKKQTSKQTKKLVDTVIKPKEDGSKKPDSAESDRSALNEPEGGIKFNADKVNWTYIRNLSSHWNKGVKFSNNVSVALKDGKATGIIIGVGLNLGTASRAELLTKYGLDQAVVNQLSPYIGVSGPEALAMANNLNVDNLDIASLNNKIQHVIGSGLAKEFNKTSTTPFHKLLPTQQTLVATMQQTLLSPVAQKNSIVNLASSVVSNAASGNWEGVLGNLVDFTNHVKNDDSFEARLINKMINESEKKLKEEVKKQVSQQTKKPVDTVNKPKEDGTKKPESAADKKYDAAGTEQKKEKDSASKEPDDPALKEPEDSVEPTYSKWAGPSGDLDKLFADDDEEGKNEKEPEEVENEIKFNAESGDVDEVEEDCPVKEKAEKDEKPVESEECEFVEIEIEKAERNFTYKWTPGNETTESKGLYEIVAGNVKKPATVKLKLKGLNAKCDTHKKTNWDLEKGPFNGDSREISCTSNKPKGLKNTLWPYGVPPKSYTVKGFTCTTAHSTIVRVYPDTHYLVNATWAFDIGDLFKSVKSPSVAFRAKVTHDGIDRELKIDKDNVSYTAEKGSEIERELAERTNEMMKALIALKNISVSLVENLKDEGTKKEPVFKMNSKLELEFEWKWRERKDSPLCEFVVEGGLYTRPLLELNWNKEILGPTVLAIPYVGAFIKGTKTLLSHLDSGELSLMFTIAGKLGFEISKGTWVLTEIKETTSFTPVQANGDISLKLEGKLEAAVKKSFFGIKAGGSAGATIGAEAGFRIGENTGLYIDETSTNIKMALDFTGLCVYAKAFCRVGLSFSVEGELPNSAKDRMSSGSTKISVESGAEAKKEKNKKGYIIKEKKNLWTKTIEIT